MKHLRPLHNVAVLLVVVGALNWGLVAFDPSFNIVHRLFGRWDLLEKAVYYAIALSGLLLAYCAFACKSCKS